MPRARRRTALIVVLIDFDHAESNGMVAVGGDALDVFEQKFAQPLHFGGTLPPQGLEPSHQVPTGRESTYNRAAIPLALPCCEHIKRERHPIPEGQVGSCLNVQAAEQTGHPIVSAQAAMPYLSQHLQPFDDGRREA